MSRESKLAKNTIILSFGTILPQLATFVILPILTGCLTKEEMGAYDLVTVLVTLILPAATLQIQTAAFRFLIDLRENKEEVTAIVSNIIIFTILTSLIALLVLFLCLPSEQISVRVWICLYFLVDILCNTCRQICRGLGNNTTFSVSAIILSLGKMFFLVVMVYFFQLGLIGTIVSLVAASFFSLCFLIIKMKIYQYVTFSAVSWHVLKKLLCYTWPMVPNGMSAWIMRLSDRLIVTAFMGIEANAVYSIANKIPNILHIVQNTFTMAWQENASIVSKDNNVSQYYSNMFRFMFDLTAGFVGVLIAVTPILFKLLIRGDYHEAYLQMPVLFIGVFFLSMATFLGGIYVAYKKTKSVGITTMIAAGVNLVIDFSLIGQIGLYAASGSTLIAYLVLFIYRIIDVQKIVKIRISWKHSIVVLLMMIFESVLCYLQKTVLNYINFIIGIVFFLFLNKVFVRNVQNLIRQKINRMSILKCGKEKCGR